MVVASKVKTESNLMQATSVLCIPVRGRSHQEYKSQNDFNAFMLPVSRKKVKTMMDVYPKYRKVEADPSISSLVMK